MSTLAMHPFEKYFIPRQLDWVLEKYNSPMITIDQYLQDYKWQATEDLFSESGTMTLIENVSIGRSIVKRFTNEFWTSGQRQSHSLHEISYRACFKAELPRFFIQLLSDPGALIYDPFMGRGTTLLEAALLDRQVAGNDVNPLSRILLEPRLNPPSLQKIAKRLDSLPWSLDLKSDIDLTMFYSPRTISLIVSLKNYLKNRKQQGVEDFVDKWIRMVATNRLTGHSSGFFSVYTLPPNQAVSPDAQKKINEKRNQSPEDRNVKDIIFKKSLSLQRDLTDLQRSRLQKHFSECKLYAIDSQAKSPLADNSVSLVITSPPFLNTVQYAADNWLRCWFNDLDVEKIGKNITMSRTVDSWSHAMTRVLFDLYRIVTPGGWVAFEVGEVRGGRIFLDEIIAPIGIDTGFHCHGIVVNQQEFTKTANCWGVRNNLKGTNTNRIVMFRK